MKISNILEWFGENFAAIITTTIIGGIVVAMVFSLAHAIPYPPGTDVIVKGTTIHGTVTKVAGENIEISIVNPDGTVKTYTYNENLLQRQ